MATNKRIADFHLVDRALAPPTISNFLCNCFAVEFRTIQRSGCFNYILALKCSSWYFTGTGLRQSLLFRVY